jgi:hypothetical protein
MPGKFSCFPRPSGCAELLLDIFLKPAQIVTASACADPQNSGTSAAKTAHRFDIKLEALAAARCVPDGAANLDYSIIFYFAQKLQCQVHRLRRGPLDIIFFDFCFLSELSLQIYKRCLEFFVNIYSYKAPHYTTLAS